MHYTTTTTDIILGVLCIIVGAAILITAMRDARYRENMSEDVQLDFDNPNLHQRSDCPNGGCDNCLESYD